MDPQPPLPRTWRGGRLRESPSRYTVVIRSFCQLLAFSLLVFAVAATGALFPPGEWYASLDKPSWNPPNWIFGPVWSVLYLTIAVAGWLAWDRRGPRRAPGAWAAYAGQLLGNGLWSWLFFGLHLPGWALVDLALLWVFIVLTIVWLWKIRPLAGAILVPYLLWVTFAGFLNAALWRLN